MFTLCHHHIMLAKIYILYATTTTITTTTTTTTFRFPKPDLSFKTRIGTIEHG